MNIENCTLKFSGHQTFPLRYGWIYKAIQEVKKGKSISSHDEVESQMIRMGVGKNMVFSIRHWIKTFDLVTCTDKKNLTYSLTPLAVKLFTYDKDNKKLPFDEYLDDIGTIWLLHWLGQSNLKEINASRWFFNAFNGLRIEKEQIVKDIHFLLSTHQKEVNLATLKKDVDCLFQMYSIKRNATNLSEDSFSSPFIELGLIVQQDSKMYLAEVSNRPTLPVEIFAFAVIDFFQKQKVNSNERTISFETLLTAEGSPGRVFRLSSSGLSEKLDELEILSKGNIAWTDTQGLRQVQHSFTDLKAINPDCYLTEYYNKG